MSRLPEWFRNKDEGDFGAFGEALWSGIFVGTDLSYIPLHKISCGGAPMLEGKDKLILPDFQTMGGAKIDVYCDSKAKRHAVVYRNAGYEQRHGIDKRNWEHYEKFSADRSRHCALAIFEAFADEANGEWSGALLMQTLVKLGNPFQQYGKVTGKGGMVYWPRARFANIGTITPDEAQRITTHYRAAEKFKEAVWTVLDLGGKPPIQGRLW